jgi:hypothetical protein
MVRAWKIPSEIGKVSRTSSYIMISKESPSLPLTFFSMVSWLVENMFEESQDRGVATASAAF